MAYGGGTGDWKHGFCDCCGNPTDCIFAYCCPCIYAAVASNDSGENTLLSVLQCFFYPCLVPLLRNKLRNERGIDGSLVGDILLGWCLPCCSIIQARREINE